MSKGLRICRAGGGSGGHVYPIRSLIQYLQQHDAYRLQIQQHYRYGQASSMEAKISHELKWQGIALRFRSLSVGKRRRETTIAGIRKNITDLFAFVRGIGQAWYRLRRDHIDLVFCKWGYSALPTVIAARILSIPIIVHESDTRPGLVNRLAARLAKYVFTGFDHVLPRAQTIGQILSDELVSLIPDADHSDQQRQEQSWLYIDRAMLDDKKVIIVTWGSLGAKALYEAVAQIHNTQELSDCYLIIIGGTLNTWLKKEFEWFDHVCRLDSVTQGQMGLLYRYADAVITRAGTTSLAEQRLFEVAQIIVPLPITHDQADNARRYQCHHGSIVLYQDSHLVTHLRQTIDTKIQKKLKHTISIDITLTKTSLSKEIISKTMIKILKK